MEFVVDLSIVIVNWNSLALLRRCLQTVYAGGKTVDFELIVVDNASFDGSAEIVMTEYPQVKFIQSRSNLGFAKANNLGAKQATGRNLLFLNPDTEILGDALGRMSSFLDTTPDAGVVGCKLLDSDMSVQTSCVQPFPSILNQALDTEFLRRSFPRLRLWGMQAIFKDDGQPACVEVISGACLMVKAAVFSRVGQFSSNYFMYAEDVDLCFKVQRAGYLNYYIGDVAVVHHGAVSSGNKSQSNFASIMMRESILEFMRLRRGRMYAVAYQYSTLLVALLRLFLLVAAFPLTSGSHKRDMLRRTLTKWLKVLRWAIGMEAWTKQVA